MSSDSGTASSTEKETFEEEEGEREEEGDDSVEVSPVDVTLPSRYAETMKMHSRLNPANQPSMSSRVLLLGFLGLLFYYAIRSKWDLRLIKGKLSMVEYDKDYTGILLEEG